MNLMDKLRKGFFFEKINEMRTPFDCVSIYLNRFR